MSTPSKLRALRSTTAALHPKRTLRHTSTSTTSPATPTTEPLRSILIANRGEIALRVNRTASQTGIRTTTLYTDPDRLSQHALSSPFAINLGSTDQYLNGQRIIQLAKENGCEAIHPGYGFLSENAQFDEIVESHNIIWIGPKPEHIRTMGDKIEAKRTAAKLGLPLVPGSDGPLTSLNQAQKVAKEIGYPVLIKAASGGGGRSVSLSCSSSSGGTGITPVASCEKPSDHAS